MLGEMRLHSTKIEPPSSLGLVGITGSVPSDKDVAPSQLTGTLQGPLGRTRTKISITERDRK